VVARQRTQGFFLKWQELYHSLSREKKYNLGDTISKTGHAQPKETTVIEEKKETKLETKQSQLQVGRCLNKAPMITPTAIVQHPT
jgi:hypothetical protein